MCVFECKLNQKGDNVYIVHPCIPTILHTCVRDQKSLCKHPSLLCNSTFISTFMSCFVAALDEAFFILLLSEKKRAGKKRWDHWPMIDTMKMLWSRALTWGLCICFWDEGEIWKKWILHEPHWSWYYNLKLEQTYLLRLLSKVCGFRTKKHKHIKYKAGQSWLLIFIGHIHFPTEIHITKKHIGLIQFAFNSANNFPSQPFLPVSLFL